MTRTLDAVSALVGTCPVGMTARVAGSASVPNRRVVSRTGG
jgi:hypothetical protein